MDNRNTKDNERTPTGSTPKEKPTIPDPKPKQPGFDDTIEKR